MAEVLDTIQEVEADQIPDPGKPVKLAEPDRIRLDSIVQKMIKNKESDEDIRFVVEDFKSKYAPQKSTPVQQPATPPKNTINWGGAPFQTIQTTPEQYQEMGAQPLKTRRELAESTLNNAWNANINDVIKNHILDEQDKLEAEQRMNLGIDNTAAPIYVPDVIRKKDREAKRNAIPEETVEAIKKDPNIQRFLIKKTVTDYKKRGQQEDAKKIEASAYVLDANDRGAKEDRIEKNASKIESGELIYDVESGQLFKPLNFGNSIVSAYKNRTKDYQGGYDLASMSKEEGIRYLNKKVSEYDPDKATPLPGTVSGLIGSEGTATLKSVLAGSLATMFSRSPALANSAAAAASADEIYMRSYFNEFVRGYDQLKKSIKSNNPELSQQEIDSKAYDEANSLAKKLASSDLAANAVMTYTGYKLGAKPINFNPGKSVLDAAKKITGAAVDFGKKAAPEALATGALSAASQGLKNEIANEAGARRANDEGVLEAGVMGAAMPLVIGALVQAPGIAKKQFLHSFRKTPIEVVAKNAADMVEDGILTPDQAEQAVSDIQQYQSEDAQIPEGVKGEDRLRARELADEYAANKQKLSKPEEGGLSEATHKPIKERQKEIEWEMDLLQKTPEEQIRLLKSKRDELQTQIDEHDTAKKEGKAGKLEDRAAVKKQLTEIEKRITSTEEKVNDPLYKAQQMIDEDLQDMYMPWTEKEIYVNMAKNDPEEFLKFVAEQAQLETFRPEDNEMVSSRKSTEDLFGKELTKAAVEKYPSPIQVKPPKVLLPNELKGATETITIKPKEDAVPVQSPDDVDVRQPSPDGETVVEGNIQSEDPARSQKQGDQGEGEKVRLSHAETERIYKEAGLPERMETPTQFRETLDAKAQKMIDEGYDFDKKVTEVMTGKGHFEAEDQAAFDIRVSDLKNQQKGLRVTDPNFDKIQNEIEKLSRASDVAGTIGGRFLQSRRSYNPQEQGISDFITRKKEALGVEDLTVEQKEKIQEVSDKIEGKKAQIKEKSKQIADKIRSLRINKGDRALSNIFSIPVAVYDGAIVTIANIVEQGGNLIDAVNAGIKYVKDNGGFKDKTEESRFRNHILNAGSQEQRLSNYKTRTRKAIDTLKEKRANKDYSKKERTPIELDEEAQSLRAELEEERHAFELDILKDEMEKQNWYQKNVATNLRKGIGTLKAITSGIDDSAVFVQNFIPILANPRIGAQSIKEHALDFWSAKRFNAKMAELHNAADWGLMKQSGLEILEPTSISEKLKEEIMSDSFHNAEIKIGDKNVNPLQLLKPFERAFTSLGNNLRVKLFREQAAELLKDKKTFKTHPEEFKSLARAINDLTGRGKLHKSIELASPAITPFIWSPRLLASGLNTLGINDAFYALQGKKGHYASMTPAQRNFALKQVGKGLGVGVSVMVGFAIAKAMGADVDVDYDPRSVTFGNVRMGNKNLNAYGRYSPIVKVLFQAIGGTRVKGGKEQDLDNPKYGGKDRGSVVGGFLRGKMTPTAGVAYDFVLNHQKDYFTNEDLEWSDIPKKVAIPMSLSNLKDGLERDGSLYLLNDFLPNFSGLKVTDQRDFQKKGGSSGGGGATQSINKPKKPSKPKKPE